MTRWRWTSAWQANPVRPARAGDATVRAIARIVDRAATAAIRPLKDLGDAVTEKDQVPQAVQGPHPWDDQGRRHAELRLLWPEVPGARAGHRAADRGGPPRDHPPDEAPGPG